MGIYGDEWGFIWIYNILRPSINPHISVVKLQLEIQRGIGKLFTNTHEDEWGSLIVSNPLVFSLSIDG